MRLIVSGLETSGKTTLSKYLAERWGEIYYPENFIEILEGIAGHFLGVKSLGKLFGKALKTGMLGYIELFYIFLKLRQIGDAPHGIFDRGPMDGLFYLSELPYGAFFIDHLTPIVQDWVQPDMRFVYLELDRKRWEEAKRARHRRPDLARLSWSDMLRRERRFKALLLDITPKLIVVPGGYTLDDKRRLIEGALGAWNSTTKS